MTDQFDRAQQLEEMQREIALKKHRTFKVTRCVACQQRFEMQQRNFRK